jgi:serine/threonine protein kinase
VIVLEYVHGTDLLKFLIARGPAAADAALCEDDARKVFLQVVQGAQHAHLNKIIHRDLKLENILYVDKTKPTIVGLESIYSYDETVTDVSLYTSSFLTCILYLPIRLSEESLNSVKIIDFGLAEHYRLGITARSTVVGTADYSAPELINPTASQRVPTGRCLNMLYYTAYFIIPGSCAPPRLLRFAAWTMHRLYECSDS